MSSIMHVVDLRIGEVDATRKLEARGGELEDARSEANAGFASQAPGLASCNSLHSHHTARPSIGLEQWFMGYTQRLTAAINHLPVAVMISRMNAPGTGVEASYLMVTCSYRSTLLPHLPCGSTRVPWTLQQLQPRRRTLSTCTMLKWPFYVSWSNGQT